MLLSYYINLIKLKNFNSKIFKIIYNLERREYETKQSTIFCYQTIRRQCVSAADSEASNVRGTTKQELSPCFLFIKNSSHVLIQKKFLQYLLHQIFRHIYETVNIVEK